MRRNDFSGAQTWIGAEVLMSSRRACRFSGRKISVSLRFVIRSVFDGREGWVIGGRPERSMDMVDDREERAVEGRDAGGEVSWDMVDRFVRFIYLWG